MQEKDKRKIAEKLERRSIPLEMFWELCDRVVMSLALVWAPTQGTVLLWLLGLLGPHRMHMR